MFFAPRRAALRPFFGAAPTFMQLPYATRGPAEGDWPHRSCLQIIKDSARTMKICLSLPVPTGRELMDRRGTPPPGGRSLFVRFSRGSMSISILFCAICRTTKTTLPAKRPSRDSISPMESTPGLEEIGGIPSILPEIAPFPPISKPHFPWRKRNSRTSKATAEDSPSVPSARFVRLGILRASRRNLSPQSIQISGRASTRAEPARRQALRTECGSGSWPDATLPWWPGLSSAEAQFCGPNGNSP